MSTVATSPTLITVAAEATKPKPKPKTITLAASSPTLEMIQEFKRRATVELEQRFSLDPTVNPRQPMNQGQAVLLLMGYELDLHQRGEFTNAVGETLRVCSVKARKASGGRGWISLGTELRVGDQVVAQRLRSPGAARLWNDLREKPETRIKLHEANQFVANWRDATRVDHLTARKCGCCEHPADEIHGRAKQLDWYTAEHDTPGMPGYIDLRPAMPGICRAMDEADAKAAAAKVEADARATAEAEAKVEALAVVQAGDATVAELRAQAKAPGIAGCSKLKKQELIDAIAAAALPGPEEILITAEEMVKVAIAINTVEREGGGLLRNTLAAIGIQVPGSIRRDGKILTEKLLAVAKRCRVAPVAAMIADPMAGDHDEADEADEAPAGT